MILDNKQSLELTYFFVTGNYSEKPTLQVTTFEISAL